MKSTPPVAFALLDIKQATFAAFVAIGLSVMAMMPSGCGAIPSDEIGAGEQGEHVEQGDLERTVSQALSPPARACLRDEIVEILKPHQPGMDPVFVNCSFTYPTRPESYIPADYPGVITRGIVISGSGVTFSCRGHTIRAESGTVAIEVWSKRGTRVSDVTVQDCVVDGQYVGNLAITPGDETLPACSPTCSPDPSADIIAFRQNTAPANIHFDNLDIIVHAGSDGVRFMKGVTGSSLRRSRISGTLGRNTAIYLSPESAGNFIVGNVINVETENREQIAIDGSANNYIADNDFRNLKRGGITIFRNCGEDGQVRLQKPTGNSIINNRFYYNVGQEFAVWVASRTTSDPETGALVNTKAYCLDDRAYNFGSGREDLDYAFGTTFAYNQVRKGSNGTSVATVVREPIAPQAGTLARFGNVAVDELSTVPTLAAGVAGEPLASASLYFVQGGRLWRSAASWGNSVALGTSNWSGATSMAKVGLSLYIVQDGYLNKTSTSGSSTPIGPRIWTGPTTMAAIGSRLFITHQDSLWVIDDLTTGARRLLGTAGYWPDPTAMTALGGYLYMVDDGYLWKIDPTTGAPTPLGGRDWPGPTSMTGIGSKLYLTNSGTLWSINNLNTGAWARMGAAGAWEGTTSMTNFADKVYAIQADLLWEMDPATGRVRALPRPHWNYAGPTVMAAM